MINADGKERYQTRRCGDGSASGAAIHTASGTRLGKHYVCIEASEDIVCDFITCVRSLCKKFGIDAVIEHRASFEGCKSDTSE